MSDTSAAPGTDILLIHGSCHGAWCWDGVLTALAAWGRNARAIDMPGRGASPIPMERAGLADFAETILADIAAAGGGPVTLVGHSAGGYAITAAAEAAPHLVARLVYLCAYVPRPGLSLAQMRRAGPRQPLAGHLRLSADRRTFSFAPESVPGLFFHDCPDPAAAGARLVAEAVAPQETALPFTARASALPRHYVRCTADRVIPPEFQAEMAAAFGPEVTDFPTGHSPFLAAPDDLAALLDRLSR